MTSDISFDMSTHPTVFAANRYCLLHAKNGPCESPLRTKRKSLELHEGAAFKQKLKNWVKHGAMFSENIDKSSYSAKTRNFISETVEYFFLSF